MSTSQLLSNKTTGPAWRRVMPLLAVAVSAICAGCALPNDVVHRVSFDVQADPKDLRACVVEAIRGVDGVPGVNPPSGGVEQMSVGFRTTLPEVTGEVERQGDNGIRVSIEVVAHREPSNFWEFAQPRAQAIADAIGARCGAL